MSLRRFSYFLSLTLGYSVPGSFASAAPPLRVDTPLAFVAGTIYAVHVNGQELLRRDANGSWVHLGRFGWIVGLTSDSGSLYVADGTTSSIYRIDPTVGTAVLIYTGSATAVPTELAADNGHVFFASAKGEVFDLDVSSRTITRVALPFARTGAQIRLSASHRAVAVSDANNGVLAVFIAAGPRATPAHPYRCLYGCGDSPWRSTKRSAPDALPDFERLSSIKRPSAVALTGNLLYFTDETTNSVYASSGPGFRPVRLAMQNRPVKKPSRILVGFRTLYILDEASREIVDWPLLVPTEITLEYSVSEPIANVYARMYQLGILPTKGVPLRHSVERTLNTHRILPGPYVSLLDPVICGLNSWLCQNGKPVRVAASNRELIVPDLYTERFIDARQIELDGKTSLDDEVDRRLKSDEFQDWDSETKLRQLNPQSVNTNGDSLKRRKNGTFIIPVELVRYVAALPADETRARTDGQSQAGSSVPIDTHALQSLKRIQERTQKITVVPLSEKSSRAQEQDLSRYLPDLSAEAFKVGFTTMLATIKYYYPTRESIHLSPMIGVAEKDVDCKARDFEGSVCVDDEQVITPALQSPPQSLSNGTGDVHSTPQAIRAPGNTGLGSYRHYEIPDHGTAVTSLIGARKIGEFGKGLASPEALIVRLSADDPQIGEDIRSAFLNGTKIFNLSLAFDSGVRPDGLARYMDGGQASAAYKSNALFVVAAPDDGEPVCMGTVRYPVCWANQPNIIAVAGTLLDGKDLIPTKGGGKWGPLYVQVAAPGVGYGAIGQQNSYVPVAGTSFAAPLVTATAALLFAQNVREPLLIKQRIIATADVVAPYSDRVSGGLLNVKRAISHIGSGVLINDSKEEKIVLLVPGQTLSLQWADGGILVPMSRILRITRNTGDKAGTFRVVFQDPQNETQLHIRDDVFVDLKKPWKVRCRAVTGTNGPGGPSEEDLASYKDYYGPIAK